jgi:hypothetical protein
LHGKVNWERTTQSFVTDRTPLDNLTYTIMHDYKAVDAEFLETAIEATARYDMVLYLPVDAYCAPGGDPHRIQDMTYHKLFDVILFGFLERFVHPCVTVWHQDVDTRTAFCVAKIDGLKQFRNL